MDDKDQTSGLGASGQGDGDQGMKEPAAPAGEPTETAEAPATTGEGDVTPATN